MLALEEGIKDCQSLSDTAHTLCTPEISLQNFIAVYQIVETFQFVPKWVAHGATDISITSMLIQILYGHFYIVKLEFPKIEMQMNKNCKLMEKTLIHLVAIPTYPSGSWQTGVSPS